MKKIVYLITIIAILFVEGCKSSSASDVNKTTTDYNPIVGFDLKSSTETSVEISSKESNVIIKYTTDGSIPIFSMVNTSYSFVVSSETTVKARTFDSNGNALSDIITVKVPIKKMPLTIMYYGDGDNDLEKYLLQDVAEMKSGYSKAGYNLIVLFDRIGSTIGLADSKDNQTFDEDFEDTRLYKIGVGTTTRLNGNTQLPTVTDNGNSDELNMGDGETLKKFIKYCKANYPADKYVLIMSNHGGGTKSVKSSSSKENTTKAICWDESSGNDFLYTGEISDTLTSAESVDVMVLDACLMGSVEFAYQFRNDSFNTGFKADYMVASPALVWGNGLPYTTLLQRIRTVSGNNGTTNNLEGGTEAYIVPSASGSMKEFAKMVVEEQYDSVSAYSSETFSAYDLSKITVLKTAIDNFAKSAEQLKLELIRGFDYNNDTAMNYLSDSGWNNYPFFDIYDLMRMYNTTASNNVLVALDDVILTSFGGSDYYNANDKTKFVNNKNGMHIVLPKTDYASSFGWYSPVSVSGSNSYGKLAFCSGGVEGNSKVETWFEMIDKWYDANSYGTKGYNNYKY